MELRIICYDLNAGKYRVVAVSQADNIYFSVRKRRTHSQVRFTKKEYALPMSYQLFVTHLFFHVLDTNFTFFLSLYATCKARFLDLNTFQFFFLFYLTQQIFI